MKPHLKKINGLWHCGNRLETQSRWIGIGYTAKLAYRDWKMFKGGA